jgi:protein disulfide-isomerase A6
MFTHFPGLNKFDSLSKFFDSVIDGTADLTVANEEAKAEEYEPTEEELEIQRKQEAQRIALLHGGYSDLIDFEQVRRLD